MENQYKERARYEPRTDRDCSNLDLKNEIEVIKGSNLTKLATGKTRCCD